MKLKIYGMLLLVSLCVAAQDKAADGSSTYAIRLETGNQSVGFPFRGPAFAVYHFYSSIGIEKKWREKLNHSSYQTIDVGYFHNSSSGSGYMIISNYGHRYPLLKSFYGSAEVGGGFIHLFRPNAVYELNANGQYEQVKDWGKIHPVVDFNFLVGYQPNRFGVYLEYNILTEFLYNKDAIFYPQTLSSIGVRYNLK